MEATYTVVLMREEDGGYCVSVPALKGCHTQGDSLAEALMMAEDAIRLHLEVLQEDGKPVPPDKPRVTVNMRNATEALVYRLAVREAAAPLAKLPVVTLSEHGEQMLREALEEVKAGKVKDHDTVESLIQDLRDEADQD